MDDYRIVMLILWVCIIVMSYVIAKLFYRIECLDDRVRDLENKEEKVIANGK